MESLEFHEQPKFSQNPIGSMVYFPIVDSCAKCRFGIYMSIVGKYTNPIGNPMGIEDFS